MELNKSLNDSTCTGGISAYIPHLQSLSKDVNAQKVTTSPCADSGYHSLSNAANSDIYASNATYAKKSNHQVTTMQADDNQEMKFQNSSFASKHDHNLIARPPVCSSSISRGHQSHQGSHIHAQNVNSANLDGNANHIHSSSEKFYDLHCIKNIYDICSCEKYFQSTVSNINTNNNEKTLSCQIIGCDCSKKPDQHNSVKSHSFNGDNLAHSNSDFKSDTSDLAEIIEFCLLFGYTVHQIRLAIFKLGYKASKNDILAELSSMQNVRPSSVGDLTSPDASTESSQGDLADQIDDLFIRKGADPGVKSEVLQSRGTLILDAENKESETTKDADDDSKNLRPIVIDGSNVAMSHGNTQYFSCKGILLAVNYFRNRNHNDITVFVPIYRKETSRHDTPIKDQKILTELEKERILVFTPSRNINGKRVTCYDDRFILKLAQETDAVVVSNDNFRDLQNERPEWKSLVEKRLLMYSFVNDRFMPPDDPLGRNGPNIDNFLRIRPASEEQSKPQCPYGKKCTYGKKCKYFHPECPRPVSERIVGKKSDNNRKKSKFSLALAAELIKSSDQHQTPSTSASSSCHQDTSSMENVAPSLHFACSQNGMDSHVPKHALTSTNESHTGNQVSAVQGAPNGDCMHNAVLGRRSSRRDVAHSQRCYGNNVDNLTEPFRQMLMSNHDVIQQSHSMSCAGHSNVHVCYDANCQRKQFVGDTPRLPPNHIPSHRPEPGPPEFHAEHQRVKQNFQRSSPANLQQGHGARSAGNSLIQQHFNVPSPYQVNPSLPAHFALPAYALYQSRYVDPHYPPNQPHPSPSQPVLRSYPAPPHSQGPHAMHPHYMGTPLYVAPVNTSTGSNNSLSRSFPYIPVQERIVDASALPHNYGSSSSHSDPHGYSIRHSGLSSGLHQQGLPHEITSPHHSHLIHSSSQHVSSEPPLSSDKNPRYYLYRNLCGLFQRPVVEAVMKAHPDIKEPKKIINLIQQMIE